MDNIKDYLLLVIGFVILIKGADFMVSGASSIAKRFGISNLVIGLTIVAFGTSAPELFVNILSGINGQTELALWNVIGSNIANILLILWVAALVYPLQAKSSTIYKEIPFSLIASFALFFLAFDTLFSGTTENIITRGESMVLLLFFVLFFAYTFGLSKMGPDDSTENQDTTKQMSVMKSTLYIIGGLVWLSIGANFLVWSAKNIALWYGISESVIGLTIIAFGTSLPELATSVIASLKRNSDIAIGNVVGSNIFNLLLVLGATWSVTNIVVPDLLLTDIIIELAAITLLIVFMFFIGKKGVITRFEGGILLGLYVIYMWYLFQTQIL